MDGWMDGCGCIAMQGDAADYRQQTMGWGAFARNLAGPKLMAAVDESEGVVDFVERLW
jgi:hypothetical protein